jgi:hypothetical protein
MFELPSPLALSSSWTARVDNGQIIIIEKKKLETKTFSINCK